MSHHLFLSHADLDTWRKRMFPHVYEPDSFPALLVFTLRSNFYGKDWLDYEWVYPSDFIDPVKPYHRL